VSNRPYNPNNCNTCYYKLVAEDDDGWCYMFRNEPNEVCMVHTGRRMSVESIIKLLQSDEK